MTGTPTASGSFNFTANITDSSTPAFTQATSTLTLVIAAPTLSLSPAAGALPGATAGASYSQSFTASGGTATYSYAVTAGSLPSGVTLTGGTISGTPTAVGTFNFTITATDSSTAGSGGPYSVANSYSIAVAAPTISLAPASLPNGAIGTAYSQAVTASGGTATYSYAVTAGALPAGLSMSAAGAISGTPSAGGTFNFTVTASDSTTGPGAPYGGSRAYAITIGAPTITLSPASLTNATVATAYSATITASGGTATYTYAVTAGALPAGLNLTAGGALSGTPTAGGSFNFTVTATDSSGGAGPYTGNRAYTLTVAAPTIAIAPASLPNATAGTAYSQAITASGGTATYSYAVTAGALPAGLSLTGDTISGTPTAGGSFNFTITATDSSGGSGPYSAGRSYTLTVAAATVTLSPTSVPNGYAGTPYSQTLTASGGNGPYTFAVTAGALPPGLSLSASGVLSGNGTANDQYTFTITATDSSTGAGAPYSGSRSYTLLMNSPNFTLAAPTLSSSVGATYTGNFVAGGGTAPYTYSRYSGTIPPGLTLASNGTLSGTPTAAGSFNFAVVARDTTAGAGAPYGVASGYTFTVSAPSITLAPATLGNGAIGTPYSEALSASGGTAPYSYAVTAGAVPAGLSLNPSTGALTGTPSAGGTFNFTITATDSSTGTGAPFSTNRAYAVTIAAPTVTIAPTTLPSGTPGVAYSQALTASGGTAPYSYAVTAGALPGGLTLSPTGTLGGTPSSAGTFSFTVTATDSSTGSGPYAGTRAYSVTVGTPTIVVDTTSLPNATVAAAYSQTVTASGGTAPYSFAITAGALPAGVNLSTGGTLSGTPSAGGTFNFTITATDSSGGSGPYSGSRALSLTVTAPTIALAPAALPNATVATPYSQAITASGGTAGYSYAVTAGALPAGLTLSPTGTLSGTATASGTFTFTVTATDSSTGTGAPYTGSRAYSLTVGAPTIALAPPTLTGGQMDVAYSQALSASGGTAPYSYAVTAGALPAGLTLSPAGTIAGTPSVHGTFNVTITATDSSTGAGAPFDGSRAYSLVIAVPTAPSAGPVSETVPYNSGANPITLAISGGTPTSVAVASAPAHGTASVSGLTITYTPATGYYGADSFTYTATNDGGTSAPAVVSITVSTPAAPTAANVSNVAVPYNSGGTAIDLAPSITGVHSSIAIGTAPAHGTTTIAGDVVTYTPAAGYYGADSFTYTATGPGGTSSPATVTLNVAVPAPPAAADLSGVAVPYGSSGTPIDLAPSITGVHSSIAIGTAPAHGTTTIAGDVVTYTPAAGYYGADSFTYNATGPGGTSNVATVTLNVALPPAPTAANVSNVAVAYNSTGTAIDLTSSVSGVYTSLAIGTAPAHGTATVTGNVVTYTPAAGYYGADSFTYTATGPGGTSSAATVTLAVDTPPPPAAQPGSSTVAGSTPVNPNSSVQINLSALVTGDYTSIQIQTPPAHGTLTLQTIGSAGGGSGIGTLASPTVIATYTPVMGYVGSDSFTFAAVGPGGASTPAAVTISIVGAVPVALPKVATTGDGQTVSVDLTAGASNGPFIAANVLSVTPANAATTAIVASGSGATQAYRLDVTANNRFGGAITIQYTLSNAYGVSASATVTVTVTARPDPTADPNVRAVSDAQAEAARRFARSQVSNFMRRTEQLHHGGGSSGAQMGVTLNSRDGRGLVQASPAFDASALAITERMRPTAADPAMGAYLNSQAGRSDRGAMLGALGSMNNAPSGSVPIGSNGTKRATAQPGDQAGSYGAEESEDDGTRRVGSVGLWSGGAIDIGTQDATTDRSKITATTSGLSGGLDIKVAEGAVIGIGGGYGNDVSHIGGGAARVRSQSSLVAAYASLMPFESIFVDGMVGKGDLSFATRRAVAAVNATANGSRDGSFTVGALALGIDQASGAVRWSIYGRGEFMNADLGAYVESGAGRYDLRFDARDLKSLTGTLGARIEVERRYGTTVITPRLRFEWNHEFDKADAQWLDYADIPGAAFYSLGTQGWMRDQFQLTVGSRFVFPRSWAIDLEGGARFGGNETAGTFRILFSKQF
ncbi:putative Ig domain-containing protein [Sphingomonas sp. MMS12-HWE2-04]|uniref:putative Ig domain-containing protein n=1 Tax=Sphingomonas sp. MMS12-HWE2-04 TaxID=3234199 RepID=UPI00384C2F7D